MRPASSPPPADDLFGQVAVGGDQVLQLPVCGVEPGFDRAQAQAQRVGDLLIRKALPIAQDDHLTVQVAQPTDGPPDAAPRFRLMPGVRELLEALTRQGDTLIGLATGNFEKAAWLKVERGKIREYFRFGGFGSDSSNRVELTKLAVDRGLALCENQIPKGSNDIVR